jgi:hypothetical protein
MHGDPGHGLGAGRAAAVGTVTIGLVNRFLGGLITDKATVTTARDGYGFHGICAGLSQSMPQIPNQRKPAALVPSPLVISMKCGMGLFDERIPIRRTALRGSKCPEEVGAAAAVVYGVSAGSP